MSKSREPSGASGSKQIGLRLPADLNRRLEDIAQREANGVSAVCRRLIARGLRAEQQHRPDDEAA